MEDDRKSDSPRTPKFTSLVSSKSDSPSSTFKEKWMDDIEKKVNRFTRQFVI